MTITLYNLDVSPPCNFVRSLAKHLGIHLKLKDIDVFKGEQFTEEYLKINPFHKVPVIDDDGFVVYESMAIAYYLLRKYAPDSELYPDNLETRTRIDQIMSCLATNIYNPLRAFFKRRAYLKTAPTAEELAEIERDVLRGIEHLIGDGKFAVGDTFTLADLFATARVTVALENDVIDHSKFPKLTSYYERIKKEQPFFDEIYGPTMKKIRLVWQCRV